MRAIIEKVTTSTGNSDFTTIRLLGLLVYQEYTVNLDDTKPKTVGFSVVPSEAPGYTEDEDEDYEDKGKHH